jgi:outer membrane receptor protein involved in Fe transport
MIKLTVSRAMLGIVAAALVTPVAAQTQGTGFLEEIVVTASKRQTTLQETPIAVSVVSAADLKEAQIQDIKDLQFLVPSLRVTQLQSSGNTNFLIRGFGNGANNAGIEPSVGVFVDGVYRSRTASALSDLPNLERVEVLRGPQSTLFGKNASAGVISVITAKPSLAETTGSASLTVGDYSQMIVKADINGPLSDTVGFSLSGSYNERDGYYENLAGGVPLGELSRYGVRGQLLFVPSENLEVRLIADYDDFDEACCGVANLLNGPTGGIVQLIGGNLVPNAPFAYEGYYDFTPVNQFQTDGLSVQFDYDFNDAVTLTSITALRNLDRFDNVDVDFTSAALMDPLSGNLTDTEIKTLTQEFRLSGSTESANWMVGAYFFDEEVDQFTGIQYGNAFRAYADVLTVVLSGGTPGLDPSPLGPLEAGLGLPPGTFFAPGQGLTELSTLDDQALSLFAQFDFDLGDKTTLTLGVNYTEDEKDITFDSTATDVFSQVDMVQVGFAGLFSALTGGQPLTPANCAAFPLQCGQAQALSTVPCSPTTGPLCNSALALQPLQFLPPNVDFPNSVEPGHTKDDDVTWTVRLAYEFSDHFNIYGSAGTGFKASSWNLSRDSRPFPSDQAAIEAAGLNVPNLVYTTRFARPEESTVYEIGLKGHWDTVSLNLAIFDQSIKDFQENIFTGTGFNLQNAGEQSTTGVEVDLRWRPSENFEGSFAATFMDPVYDSFPDAEGVDDDPNSPTYLERITIDLSGTQPAGIHEVSLTAAGRYSFMMGNAAGYIRAEYIYEDEVRVIANTPKDVASREVSTINASAGLSWDNGFEVMLWGRNLNDDEYLLSAFPSVAQNGSFSGYPNQPRTYGLTVRKYFD